MSKGNKILFFVLQIIAWVIFVGLAIELGGLLVNFVFSIFNPKFVPNLYQKLDLTQILAKNQGVFYSIYALILLNAFLKFLLFYLVIILLLKLDINHPFNRSVSNSIIKISTVTFGIGIASIIGMQLSHYFINAGYPLEKTSTFWNDGQAFILMAAVIYIIAIILKRGVEIQEDQDLTV